MSILWQMRRLPISDGPIQCISPSLPPINRENQLEFKRNIILKAFERYFPAGSDQIPAIDPTNASPVQYGYRTKITPHFDIPRGVAKRRETMEAGDIGFQERTRSKVMDIEGTPPSRFLLTFRMSDFYCSRERRVDAAAGLGQGNDLCKRSNLVMSRVTR
jgi:tRNA/tmRNA/rRNA uracil-C5-methylase (TrmA/RlmC/RlmD family)